MLLEVQVLYNNHKSKKGINQNLSKALTPIFL